MPGSSGIFGSARRAGARDDDLGGQRVLAGLDLPALTVVVPQQARDVAALGEREHPRRLAEALGRDVSVPGLLAAPELDQPDELRGEPFDHRKLAIRAGRAERRQLADEAPR